MFENYAARIAQAKNRQRQAFFGESSTPPLNIFCNQSIGFGAAPGTLPPLYFHDPAVMLAYQEHELLARMERIQDDFVPYLYPQFGTGVVASAFGSTVHYLENTDPAVGEPCIASLEQIEHLNVPDVTRAGLMPKVLDTIDYMKTHSDLPVGLTDTQGVLDTCAQLCGHTQLFHWMYDEPEYVHRLFEVVAQTLSAWILEQKKHIADPDGLTYCQILALPEGFGAVLAEDDAVFLSPHLYRKYCVPANAQVFEALGGGMIHFCGDATHHIKSFRETEGLRGFHVIPLGNFDILTKMQGCLGEQTMLAAAEFLPSDPDRYYTELLNRLDPRRLIVEPYVVETVLLGESGYKEASNDRLAQAEHICQIVTDALHEQRFSNV